jgi:hypothetical protein
MEHEDRGRYLRRLYQLRARFDDRRESLHPDASEMRDELLFWYEFTASDGC